MHSFFVRFKREEIKIQAWENHQIAKTEARMRKIEVMTSSGTRSKNLNYVVENFIVKFKSESMIWYASHIGP